MYNMDFGTVIHDLNLNRSKIGKYSFCSFLPYYYKYSYKEQKPETKQIVSQIATNLEYVYTRFDDMNTSDSVALIRKSCVKSFELEFCTNHSSMTGISAIGNGKKQQAKSKLLWLINRIRLFILE